MNARSATISLPAPSTARAAAVPRREAFRPDIQGLRAVAVLLVALSHAGVPHLRGGYVGVDVFFVISAFLITGWLVRRAQRTGRVPFADFYAARARRILPAATLTIVATCLGAWYLMNYLRALSTLRDAVWAAFFAANVHFANVGTDYFARDNPPSPLQHFWTLAVEEQFYVVWPALLAVVLLAVGARRRHGPDHDAVVLRRLAFVVAAFVAASLAWSIHITPRDPVGAYYSTPARAWELGLGALLALCAPQLARLPGLARAAFSWLGVGAILLAAVTYSSSTAFPGYAALVPVVGSALVIAGGLGQGTFGGAGTVLSRQPFRLVGDVSYSLYLWHWPVLIIAAAWAGRTLSVADNLGLLVLAFGISVATYVVYEDPLRHGRPLHRPRYALLLWPVSVLIVLAVVHSGRNALYAKAGPPVPLQSIVVTKAEKAGASRGQPGVDPYAAAVAAAVTPAVLASPIPDRLIPSPLQLPDDREHGCVTWGGMGRRCTLGAVHSPRRIVVFGDSHAAAWLPGLAYYARTHGFALKPLVTASCTAGVAAWPGHCHRWYTAALARMRKLRPAAVIVGQYFDPREPDAATYGGLRREIAAMTKFAPRVVILQDPPRHDVLPIDCLLQPGATLGDCAFHVEDDERAEYGRVAQIARAGGAVYMPTLQWFCAKGTCPMVVGRMIVYIDSNHMALTYSRVIAPGVGAALAALLHTPR